MGACNVATKDHNVLANRAPTPSSAARTRDNRMLDGSFRLFVRMPFGKVPLPPLLSPEDLNAKTPKASGRRTTFLNPASYNLRMTPSVVLAPKLLFGSPA